MTIFKVIPIVGLLLLFIGLLIIIKNKINENKKLRKTVNNLYNIIKENNRKTSFTNNKLSELQELKKKLDKYQ